MLIPFTYHGYMFVQEKRANAPEGYEFPSIYDFKTSLILSIFFAYAQVYIKKNMQIIFLPWVKKCQTEDERLLRAGKGSYQIWKFILMTISTTWGWNVLKDQPFFPKSLGGTGDYALMWVDYPYQKHCD